MEVMIRWPRLLPVNMLMIIVGIARMMPSTLDPHARITPSAWLKTLPIQPVNLPHVATTPCHAPAVAFFTLSQFLTRDSMAMPNSTTPAIISVIGPPATAITVPMPARTGNVAVSAPMALTTPAMIGSTKTRPAANPPIVTSTVVIAGLLAANPAMPSASGVIRPASAVSGGSSELPTATPSRWVLFWKLVSVPAKVLRLRLKSSSTVPAAAVPPASALSFSYSLRYFISDTKASFASLSPKIWPSLNTSPPVTRWS